MPRLGACLTLSDSLEHINWSTWIPGVKATLVFLIRDNEVLLIHKKTGLGKGKVNAPGGKLEIGETSHACAIREVLEEVGISVSQLEARAELRFIMTDHPDILCTAYVSTDFSGVPIETPEAAPFWVSTDEIPYTQMWSDDALWLPAVLKGGFVRGDFMFEGDKMLAHTVEYVDSLT